MLTKSCFITGTNCPKALYFQTFSPSISKEESAQDKKSKRNGALVGKYARIQYPNGILINELDTELALQHTQKAIEQGALTLFEAAFMAHGVLVRTDILTRTSVNAPWQLHEVKATAYNKQDLATKNDLARDLAIQVWVLQHCGIHLDGVFLKHVNGECIYPDLENLLIARDYRDEVDLLMPDIDRQIQSLQSMLTSRNQPDIDIGQHCEKPRDCPFTATCWNHIPTYSAFNIPNLKTKWKLYQNNQHSIEQLSEDNFTSKRQKRALRCYKTNTPFFDAPTAKKILETWVYPISYFDIEAISYPIPLYPKSRPYQDLPFQFSCHIQRSPIAQLEHYEFLFDCDEDPRPAFIESMLKVLPTEGSIVVYHKTYEVTKLKDLARDFPEYTNAMNQLILRIVDLKEVVIESIYHPEFLGSYSIKKVAPVLLGQEVSYDHLAIGDGMEAALQYQELMELGRDDPRRTVIRNDLLEYCKKDTLLMENLHKWFQAQLQAAKT